MAKISTADAAQPDVDQEADAVTAPADDAAQPDVDQEAQPVAVDGNADGFLIPMHHSDGGTCDRYSTDADGNILVPANDAAIMLSHGFVVAD